MRTYNASQLPPATRVVPLEHHRKSLRTLQMATDFKACGLHPTAKVVLFSEHVELMRSLPALGE